jgi:hypothetical protein
MIPHPPPYVLYVYRHLSIPCIIVSSHINTFAIASSFVLFDCIDVANHSFLRVHANLLSSARAAAFMSTAHTTVTTH